MELQHKTRYKKPSLYKGNNLFQNRLPTTPRSLNISIDVLIDVTFNNAVSSSVYWAARLGLPSELTINSSYRLRTTAPVKICSSTAFRFLPWNSNINKVQKTTLYKGNNLFQNRLQTTPRSLCISIDVLIDVTFNNAVSSSVYWAARLRLPSELTINSSYRLRTIAPVKICSSTAFRFLPWNSNINEIKTSLYEGKNLFQNILQTTPRPLYISIDVIIDVTFNNAVSSSVCKNTRNISNTTATMDCKLRKRR